MHHISLYLYILLAAIIVGIIYRQTQPQLLSKWVLPFLILTLAVEVTGLIMSIRKIENLWLYNFFTSFEFIFYSLIYRKIIENALIKKLILYSVFIYLILFIINISFIQGFYKYHTVTYRIGSVMIVFWCYLYFKQLMQSTAYTLLFRNPFFWISSGLMFFYAGFFFYMTAGDIILYAKIPYNDSIWFAISDTLNFLLYTCFLISFICRRNMRTSLQ